MNKREAPIETVETVLSEESFTYDEKKGSAKNPQKFPDLDY